MLRVWAIWGNLGLPFEPFAEKCIETSAAAVTSCPGRPGDAVFYSYSYGMPFEPLVEEHPIVASAAPSSSDSSGGMKKVNSEVFETIHEPVIAAAAR